jgi:protocatechuate 3,4-dioxygenase beta subunit
VAVNLACELDERAIMSDPAGFRAQMLAQRRQHAETDADGRFRFSAMPATQGARLVAHGQGALGLGRTLTLLAGDTYEVLIPAIAGAELAISVRNQEGLPVADASVELLRRDLTGTVLRGRTTRSATTDSAGRAVLAPLAGGAARLSVRRDGHVALHQDLEVTPGERRTLEVKLDVGATVAGSVVDEHGAPVADAGLTQQPTFDVPLFGDAISTFSGGTFAKAALKSRLRSGADGKFQLTGLDRSEPFTLVAAHADYVATTLAKVQPGTLDLRVVLRAGAQVRGEVVRARDGAPVTALSLTLLTSFMGMMEVPQSEQKVTVADGRFALRRLMPGKFTLRISAAGFTDHDAKVDLQPDTDLDLGRIELQDPARIAGRVVDRDGRGVAGATVRVRKGGLADNEIMAAMRGGTDGARSLADGTFTIDAVPAGKAQLRANAAGYAPVESERLTVAAGAELRDVVLTLGHGGGIRGRLILPPGGDPEHWDVMAGEQRGAHAGSAVIAADGTFTVENLLPGRYNVQAMNRAAMQTANAELADRMREGGTFDFAAMMKNATRSTVQARCTVQDGETAEVTLDASELEADGIELLLDVQVGDQPVATGFVEVSGDTGTVRTGLLDKGRGEVVGLQPGTYSVQVREGLSLAPLGNATAVTVTPKPAQQRVTLRLPGGRLSGAVVHDRTGEPLARAFVRVHGQRAASDRDADLGFALTDEQGRFSVGGLDAGTYTVIADDQLSPTGGSAGGRIEALALGSGQHRHDLVLRARPTAGVSVKVLDALGNPAAFAMVLAVDEQGTPVGSRGLAFADAQGRVFLAGLPAGRIRVAARVREQAPGVSEARDVAPGTEVEIEVRLRRGTRVEVSIVDRSGQPLRGAAVAVRGAQGPWLPASLLASRAGGDALDLGELPPGRARFMVQVAGQPPFEVEREIPAGRRASLVLMPER